MLGRLAARIRNITEGTSRSLAASSHRSEEYSLQNSGLPLEQRCKNILAGNWRGQLSTIRFDQGSREADESAIHSALVRYSAPKGALPAILLLSKADELHVQNIAEDPRASLTIGRTDPPVLVNTLGTAGFRPACINLLGRAEQLQPGELGYALRRAQKVYLRIAGFPTDWEQLQPEVLGFRFQLDSCRYVDLAGAQHQVPEGEVDAAFADPLAPSQVRLLESINSDAEHLGSLPLFCAAYLQTRVRQALLIQADRLGFTMLAEPVTDEGPGKATGAADERKPWREFRIAFTREVSGVDGFMHMLKEMRKEVENAAQTHQPSPLL